jgi:hypothetical protein
LENKYLLREYINAVSHGPLVEFSKTLILL